MGRSVRLLGLFTQGLYRGASVDPALLTTLVETLAQVRVCERQRATPGCRCMRLAQLSLPLTVPFWLPFDDHSGAFSRGPLATYR
jgi:hypothetical protein